MSSVRPPRAPWSLRASRRDGADGSEPPPGVADLLARRGWVVVERGEMPVPVPAARPGQGGAGPERWVVSDGSGRYRDVGLVQVPVEPAARDLLVERLAALRRLDHEHLAPVEEVVEGGAGYLVVVSRRPPGGGLWLLAGCRGPFEAGEAVTLLVPLTRALAALHACGLSYGGLTEADVLVDAEGRAVLRAPLDLCAAPAADDVSALAELVAGLLPPPAAGGQGHVATATSDRRLAALHAELAAACRADPRTRPEVGTFGALCYEAAPPTPIAMPDGARLAAAAIAARPGSDPTRWAERSAGREGSVDDTAVRPPGTTGRAVPVVRARPGPGGRETRRRREHHARRRRSASGAGRHPAFSAGLVLMVCALLTAGGVLVRSHLAGDDAGPSALPGSPRSGAPAAPGASDPGPVPPDPTLQAHDPAGAAVELTERRVQLLTGTREPAEVLAPGSPAEAVDAELLDRVAASRIVIEGARASGVAARLVTPDEDREGAPSSPGPSPSPGSETQVEVTYSVSAHIQRAADGSVTTVAATEASTARLTLRWTDSGWRVSEVA